MRGNWQNPVDTPLFLWYCRERYGVIMTVKLTLLKSGENVIADIKELVDQDEKVVSLIFTNPYVVNLLTPQILFEGNSVQESEHKVSFYPWIPLSKDKEMAVDPSWIVTVVEPQDMIKSSYESKMNSTVEEIQPKNTIDDIWSNVPLVDESIQETLIENFEVITEEKDG
jgi:hypothetical protein